jgi:hypothetical protein
MNCRFANFGNAAVEIQDSQGFNISFFSCIFLGYTNIGSPSNNITVTPKTAVLSWDPMKFSGFSPKDVGKWIEITENDGSPHNVVRTTIKAWDPSAPNQVTITDQCPIGGTAGNGVSGVVFGSQCAVACRALQPAHVTGKVTSATTNMLGRL